MTRLKKHNFTVLYNILGLFFLLINRLMYTLMTSPNYYLYRDFLDGTNLIFFEWLGLILVICSTFVLIKSISKEYRRKS
ncbi:MAG: hypothetical protein GX233_05765 [Erysipelothrix sp.]|nr:hypothetical protein [Erysipelothrix sp.]